MSFQMNTSFLWLRKCLSCGLGVEYYKFCINAPLEQQKDRVGRTGVQAGGRFFQEKHRRINNQLHADICSLPLSTRNTTNPVFPPVKPANQSSRQFMSHTLWTTILTVQIHHDYH